VFFLYAIIVIILHILSNIQTQRTIKFAIAIGLMIIFPYKTSINIYPLELWFT